MSTRNRTRSDNKVTTASQAASPTRARVFEKSNKRGTTGKAKGKRQYCICKGVDDGTPMVQCAQCKNWYHFGCLGMSERDFEEISVYICPSCSDNTGRRTVMDWEGPEGLEETPFEIEQDQKSPEEAQAMQSESEPSSEDEYVADDDFVEGIGNRKRRVRRVSVSSDSGSSVNALVTSPRARRPRRPSGATKRPNVTSISPPPQSSNRPLKRKPQPAPATAHKRKRSISTFAGVEDDPARKYCLTKYQEMFTKIFLRYPHDANGQEIDNTGELSEEDKLRLEDEAKGFASGLELCIFETYAERDKDGSMAALGKYKERFRTHLFNLTKDDRVVIHKHIASGGISPKELSLLSSTDLANEETKQSIKAAEQEALAHSILQPTNRVPVAKITHKGLQDIEHESGEVSSMLARDRQDDLERERPERSHANQEPQRRLSVSISSEPTSPIVSHTPASWMGPPAALPGDTSLHSPVNQSFTSPPSDILMSTEPELKLDELINIEEDSPTQDASMAITAPEHQETTTTLSTPPQPQSHPSSPTDVQFPTSPTTPNDHQHDPVAQQSSFDLKSLWTGPSDVKVEEPVGDQLSPPPQEQEQKSSFTEAVVAGQEPDDQDFDMFLEEKDQEEKNVQEPAAIDSPQASQAKLDALPLVWFGKVSMPLDSTVPKEVPVVARQIGGRNINSGSLSWQALFPSDSLAVAGRVPVDQSSLFLLQNRLNSSRELIAVAFSPATTESDLDFKTISDFLIAKGRHGLIFPWGQRPKEHLPGRELYLIPLLSYEPIPDYMELLDELHLPKLRTRDYLVGIWVLTKGKLAPPVQPLPGPPPLNIAVAPVPPPLPSMLAPLAPPPSFTAGITGALPIPQPASFAPPASSPLEASVASLTPEQIKFMIQTLTSNQQVSIPTAPPPLPPPPMWTNPPQTFPSFAPVPIPQNPVPPLPPSSHHQEAPYDRDREYRDSRSPKYDRGAERDHRSRGWRGRGRGRGRGREYREPVDSGWPKRSRGEGGPGSSPSKWG